MDVQPFFTNENERLIIQTIREASAKKKPTTFVIRVVDGITQFMIAEPSKTCDIRHVDKRNGNK